tara:strand:+ start:13622 stop:14287 length:666 start_codon:yes stop_codon:yes gene_type:complete
MGNETLLIKSTVDSYIKKTSLRESEVLIKCREETSTLELSRMQLSPDQGQLLSFLVELIKAKKSIEIGTFTGYSALCVALVLPQDGCLVACDISKRWTSIAQRYWIEAGVEEKIDLRIGPALETLDKLISIEGESTYDFALIDADKENYDRYYEKLMILIRPGGIICIDNVLWSGKVADPTNQEDTTVSIRSLNEKIFRDERVTLTMLPIGDGMTVVKKKQ